MEEEKSNTNAGCGLLLESAEDGEDLGFAGTTASVSNVTLCYRSPGRMQGELSRSSSLRTFRFTPYWAGLSFPFWRETGNEENPGAAQTQQD